VQNTDKKIPSLFLGGNFNLFMYLFWFYKTNWRAFVGRRQSVEKSFVFVLSNFSVQHYIHHIA
jgi:hypothetical protein